MPRWCYIALLLSLSACVQEPFERPGTWAPMNANDANLRSMVVNPHDLVQGRGESTSLTSESSPAAVRLLTGRRYPVMSTQYSSAGVSPEPQPQPASPNNGGQAQ